MNMKSMKKYSWKVLPAWCTLSFGCFVGWLGKMLILNRKKEKAILDGLSNGLPSGKLINVVHWGIIKGKNRKRNIHFL